MIAARTRIWPAKGHYMGLNLDVFWQTNKEMPPDFVELQSDGFTGVFPVPAGKSGPLTCCIPAFRGPGSILPDPNFFPAPEFIQKKSGVSCCRYRQYKWSNEKKRCRGIGIRRRCSATGTREMRHVHPWRRGKWGDYIALTRRATSCPSS